MALSFHIGLTTRVFARLAKPQADAETVRFPESWRRIEQADDALDEAEEAEDFQAIGMRCRECVLTLRELVTDDLGDGEAELPVTGDLKGWAALIVRKMETRERPRTYLKSVANIAWDYVAWLTHARDAEHHDAREAIGATMRVLVNFGALVRRSEQEESDRCPQCDSNQLHYDADWADEDHTTLNDITTSRHASLAGGNGWSRHRLPTGRCLSECGSTWLRPRPFPRASASTATRSTRS
ncbi:MAG: hypothetical protein ACLPVY_00635 [Acidimicrobiia bacterium]